MRTGSITICLSQESKSITFEYKERFDFEESGSIFDADDSVALAIASAIHARTGPEGELDSAGVLAKALLHLGEVNLGQELTKMLRALVAGEYDPIAGWLNITKAETTTSP